MVDDLYFGPLKVGDWATWAAAIGSAAAAVAAFLAAKEAVHIANRQVSAAEHDRIRKCRSIAPAIGPELRIAARECEELARRVADAIARRSAKDLYVWARQGFLIRVLMIEKFVDQYELFGVQAGPALSACAAAVLGLRTRVHKWCETGERFENLGLNDPDIERLITLEAEARMVIELVGSLGPVLTANLGGKTRFEV